MIKILLSTFCLVGSTIETRCPFVLTSTLYCVNIRRRRRINDEKFVKIYDNWAKRKQKISWKWGDFRKVSINLSSRAWNPGRERSLAVWTNPNINSEARGGPHIMWHRQFFICTSLHVINRAWSPITDSRNGPKSKEVMETLDGAADKNIPINNYIKWRRCQI